MAAPAAPAPLTLRAEQLKIFTVVASYFIISIALVFVNKVLLTPGSSIPAPLFITWFQCVITVAILYGLGEVGASAAPGSFFAQFPRVTYDAAIARRLLPLAGVFVGMIAFNNLALKFVEVSFYNVARSLTIVFNVILTFFLLGESTSLVTCGTLAIVIVGFFLGSKGEVHFSWTGTLFGVASSLFVALNGIVTKASMGVVDGNQWRLSAYNNINASLLFLPLILLAGEGPIILTNSRLLSSPLFWSVMVAGGAFGFLIGIVTILQIKVTSPLTHNISGTAKACVQTVLALWIWGNPTTFENLLGTALVLLGSAAYTYVRTKELEAAKAATFAAIATPSGDDAKAPKADGGGGAEEGSGGSSASDVHEEEEEVDMQSGSTAQEAVPMLRNGNGKRTSSASKQ